MAYNVVLFSGAVKDFESLPKEEKTRIGEALRDLSDYSQNARSIKKLQLPLEGYRKRVGQYRILFDINNSTISIHAIKHRKDAYR